jgi:lipopolysaccharide/colanic/teichoic acid biosynthesis glycosyltransferase
MDGLAFSKDQLTTASVLNDFAASASANSSLPMLPDVTTSQSGLPLAWSNGRPESPRGSASRAAQLLLKRIMDIGIAAAALIFLLPLLVIISVAVKITSKGPVLFLQQREGLNGNLFWALKFRSMLVEHGDPSGISQTVKDDPRVSPVGRFIRKTSIDELPQLINVLLGDMSLVGPRPHVAGMMAGGLPYKILIPYYNDRLAMRPGITGWAQANGFRGQTADASASSARVDHDIAYIQNFSVLLDIKILVKTIVAEFVTGTGH